MRVFAGPNGSGKSPLFQSIKRMLQIDHFVNADEIEKNLKETGFINLYDFGIKSEEGDWNSFLESSSLPAKAIREGFEIQLAFKNNILVHSNKASFSYEAAMIAEFLRLQLIQLKKSFSFETVMSHPSKIELFDYASAKDFRNYLYFICTEIPLINQERVTQRTKKGGHPVPLKKVEERYFKSLELLAQAVSKTYRAFVLIIPVLNKN